MTAGGWRALVPLVSLAGLLAVCQKVAGGHSVAGSARDASVEDVGTDARPAAPAANVARSRPAARLSTAACRQLKQRVERELAAVQRCKADSECIPIGFEYAFRPCGESARAGASLDKAAADAKAYVAGCQPVLRPVKCAHRITPVCARGRCALTTPPGE